MEFKSKDLSIGTVAVGALSVGATFIDEGVVYMKTAATIGDAADLFEHLDDTDHDDPIVIDLADGALWHFESGYQVQRVSAVATVEPW